MWFCVLEIYEISAQNTSSSQPTKIMKNKNANVFLRCSILDKHEVFNQNGTASWWFKKICKVSCWNQLEENDGWNLIPNQSKMVLELDDDSAKNGFYLCKIYPYYVSQLTVLHIEVTKTFQLELFGRFFLPNISKC